jgi:hypothetical protein
VTEADSIAGIPYLPTSPYLAELSPYSRGQVDWLATTHIRISFKLRPVSKAYRDCRPTNVSFPEMNPWRSFPDVIVAVDRELHKAFPKELGEVA